LMLIAKLPDEAHSSFDEAIEIAKASAGADGFALAMNGRGCAWYGRIGPEHKEAWTEANKDFAQAGREMDLPIVLWNLRALGVATENVAAPDLLNSPLFRLTDFLDWNTLIEKTRQQDEAFRIFLGTELPAEPNEEIIAKMNEALDQAGFYEKIKDHDQLAEVSEKLKELIDQTAEIRTKKAGELTDEDRKQVRLVNRLLLETVYPYLLARHEYRDPGMQLTLRHGIVDAYSHKSGLSTQQLVGGHARMQTYDWIRRGVATLPFTGGLTDAWGAHLKAQMGVNERIIHERTGVNIHPAGVAADLRKAYIESADDSPMVNWFGLVQTVALPDGSSDEDQ